MGPGAPAQPLSGPISTSGSAPPNAPSQQESQSQSANPRIKKTLADVLASQQGVTPPRKRKRVHYSCAECHRRKHRCDRNIPCQPCLERGLGDSCRPFQDGDEFGDERDRLKRLEDLVEGLARAHATLSEEFNKVKREPRVLTGKSLGISSIDDVTSAVERDEATIQSGSGKNASRHEKRSRMERLGSVDMEREELRKGSTVNDESGQAGLYAGAAGDVMPEGNSLEGGLTREGDSFYGALALPSVSRGVIETQIHGERLELSSNVPLRSASAKVHRLIQEGGASPNVIDELMGCLPAKEESDAMLEWFFRDINDTRLPLHERTFRASYEEIMHWRWGDLRDEEGDDGARHIPFLAFLFVILAIAKRSEPVDRCPSDEEARRGALFYLHCARRSMAIASAVRADHIDVLLAALYGARLLITLRQSAESWSLLGVAIRAAQAIGLHRDGTKLGLDAVTTERRRRLWAMIFYLDRTTSMLLGRPQAIDDKTADTLPPSDVDIDVLPRMGPAPVPQSFPPSNPPSDNKMIKPPGVFCYIAIRHSLAMLVGRIVEHFQNLSTPRNYGDVLQIDADLQKFYAALPAPFLYNALHGDKADYSFDNVCPWLPIHRYLLNIEYHYVRNALHRPYLLRSERYKQSREAAFESAKADRIIRREYSRQVQWPTNRARNSHLGGVYRKFASTLIAGIELLLEPNGTNSKELHEYLDNFLSTSTKTADPSQCTKRELAIIKIFKAKATDPTWCAAKATGGRSTKVNTDNPNANDGFAHDNTLPAAVMEKGSDSIEQNRNGMPFRAPPANDHIKSENLPTSRAETNELAQALLDRLGGMESFQVLNQNQSPSSASATSLELGMSGSGGATLGNTQALAPAPNYLANGRTTPSQIPAVSNRVPLHSSDVSQPGNGLGDAQAYGLSNGFEGLFEGNENGDWFSNLNAASSEANAFGLGALSSQTPAANLLAKDDNEFAGWGTLVEAIVSGQDNQ